MPRRDRSDSLFKRIIIATTYYVHAIGIAAILYALPHYSKQPYHTSALTGVAWVKELKYGHPDRIWTELGMRLHVFIALVAELRLCGLADSRYVGLEEQVAIFSYTLVTGMSIRHVAERFQRSNETISKYFCRILVAVSSPPFYTKQVQLPKANQPTSSSILNNPKLFPFFEGALGAIDGTHINCSPSAAERDGCRNRKGGLSQNCLACCSFELRFLYMVSGWEGSAADGALYINSRYNDLAIPAGKFYLADAGFGACDALLVPYCGIRYHLAEWGRANIRPANYKELFNLRHAQGRNVIERIFGVIKQRWEILNHLPQFDMSIQARIPPACAALHNFIMDHDSNDVGDLLAAHRGGSGDAAAGDIHHNLGELATTHVTPHEKQRAEALRDDIAQQMWDSY